MLFPPAAQSVVREHASSALQRCPAHCSGEPIAEGSSRILIAHAERSRPAKEARRTDRARLASFTPAAADRIDRGPAANPSTLSAACSHIGTPTLSLRLADSGLRDPSARSFHPAIPLSLSVNLIFFSHCRTSAAGLGVATDFVVSPTLLASPFR